MNLKCEMTDSEWDSLALGALEPEIAQLLVAHLKGGCVVCGVLFGEAQSAALGLAASLPGQAPSQMVEDKLRAYTKDSGPNVVRLFEPRKKDWFAWMIAAASLAGVIWMGWSRPDAVPSVVPMPVVRELKVVEQNVVERLVDPNPELQKRILQLEGQLTGAQKLVEPAADPRLQELEQLLLEAQRKLAQAPTVMRVEDKERVLQLEAQVQNQQKAFAELQQARDKRLEQAMVRLGAAEGEARSYRNSLEDYRRAFATLESNGMRQVELASVDASAQKSAARALYSQQGGLLVFAHDLPKLPEQKCYQLWILRKGTPSIVSGGLMKLDSQGRGFLQSPASALLKDATGFAITDEPLGGSVVARGRKLLFGAL